MKSESVNVESLVSNTGISEVGIEIQGSLENIAEVIDRFSGRLDDCKKAGNNFLECTVDLIFVTQVELQSIIDAMKNGGHRYDFYEKLVEYEAALKNMGRKIRWIVEGNSKKFFNNEPGIVEKIKEDPGKAMDILDEEMYAKAKRYMAPLFKRILEKINEAKKNNIEFDIDGIIEDSIAKELILAENDFYEEIGKLRAFIGEIGDAGKI